MKGSMRYIITGFAVVFLVIGSGCVSKTPVTPASTASPPISTTAPIAATPATVQSTSTQVVVEIKDFAFVPAIVTISKGTTVIWTQEDSIAHTVTGNGFDSGSLSKGQTFSHTFNEAGTFNYHCSLHPTIHKGTIIVT